jgi:NitT/TauT family transport system substrate-binding protein
MPSRHLISIALCAAFLATACERRAEPVPPLRLGYDLWTGYYPGHYALGSGIFDSLGVSVEIDLPENSSAMLGAFAVRRYDLIAAPIADILPLIPRMPSVRAIFCTDESAGADAVFAGRGIASARQLAGKRIGMKLGGFSELFVRQMLRDANVRPEEVEMIDVDAAAVPTALAEGTIDAGHSWEPYITPLRADGYSEIFTSEETPGLIVECVFTHADIVESRGEELRQFVTGWFLAQERLLASPEEGLRIVATALARPEVPLSLTGVRFFDRTENQRRFAGDSTVPALRTTIENHGRFLGSVGRMRAMVDAKALLDGRFLQ